MKYLSTLIFLAAMYWSWALATQERPISEQVHVSIQNDVKQIITEYVQSQLPNSSDLRFEKFWTETVDDNQVKVTFMYSFEDTNEEVGEARTSIEGYTFLRRVSETADATDWDFVNKEIFIINNQVEYKDPIKITPAPASGN